jgi:hypothetical protein
MKMKALTLALALGTTMMAGAAGAAVATIDNVDANNIPFDGFDWAGGGTAYTVGFNGTANDTFDLKYFAVATAFLVNGANSVPPGMDTVADGAPGPVFPATPFTGDKYEYTIVATLNEKVESCTTDNTGNTSCTFDVLGGTFDIYYDTSSNANATAGSNGTGFSNGTLLISGTVNPLTGQTFDTTTGSNSTTLTGTINFTSSLIDPALLGTTFTSTLQIGAAQTNYVDPGGFGGTPFSALQNPNPGDEDVVFQADANQSFTASVVPEPGSLALLGLGLGALGWIVRRKQS